MNSICLFLVSGHTFTFRNYTISSDNETAITFEYRSMSDGKIKLATFYKQHIAGISVLDYEQAAQQDSTAR